MQEALKSIAGSGAQRQGSEAAESSTNTDPVSPTDGNRSVTSGMKGLGQGNAERFSWSAVGREFLKRAGIQLAFLLVMIVVMWWRGLLPSQLKKESVRSQDSAASEQVAFGHDDPLLGDL